MLIEREHKCEHCKHEFEWVHQPKQWLSGGGGLVAETIPEGKVQLYRVTRDIKSGGYKLPVSAQVYCPKCERLNLIEIEYD